MGFTLLCIDEASKVKLTIAHMLILVVVVVMAMCAELQPPSTV